MWALHTLGSAYMARRRLGGKGKGIRQKLPLLSKTRELHVTKRGKNGSTFKFKFGVVDASFRAKSEAQWRGEKGGSLGGCI